MSILGIYGYLMPYKQRVANVLEIAVLIDYIILLLFKGNPGIEVLDTITVTTDASSTPSKIITAFSIVLASFYYFPALMFVVVCGLWIANSAHKKLKQLRKSHKTVGTELVALEEELDKEDEDTKLVTNFYRFE